VGIRSFSPIGPLPPPYLSELYGDIDASGANILGRYRREFTDTSAITVQAYYDYNDREEDYYQQTFNTLDLDIQYETDIGDRNSITMGGGYRQVDGEFENSFMIQLSDSTDDLYNAFIQDEIKLIEDRLSLTLGTKWEHNDYTGSEWQPSGRLLWKPLDNHSIWASVARAVRTPSIVEHKGRLLTSSFPPPLGTGITYIKGNEDFQSEEVLAYEAGYRWQTSTEFSLDLAVFYNDYEDLYSVKPVPSLTGLDYTLINAVEGETYGLEVAADWKPAPWLSFIFTYSYLEMDF
jgi:iron complex outermembrane receptor protein